MVLLLVLQIEMLLVVFKILPTSFIFQIRVIIDNETEKQTVVQGDIKVSENSDNNSDDSGHLVVIINKKMLISKSNYTLLLEVSPHVKNLFVGVSATVYHY